MHSIFFIFALMKKETYDYALKSTWQLVSNMYNREALKFESTMVIGFALLSIDQKGSSVTCNNDN